MECKLTAACMQLACEIDSSAPIIDINNVRSDLLNSTLAIDSSSSVIINKGGTRVGCGEGGSILPAEAGGIVNAGTMSGCDTNNGTAANGQFDKVNFHVVPIVVMGWKRKK